MPLELSAEGQYLAVVSEWSSYNARGGLLGNAYPVYSYDSDSIVEQPEDLFFNPGYVFLLARDTLAAWDFVRLRPALNEKYQNRDRRDCGYLSHSVPELITKPEDQGNVATILDVPDFNPVETNCQLQLPPQNVTPLFFVRNRSDKIFGPLIRQRVLRSEQETLEAITWSLPSDAGVVGEFTIESLSNQHVRQAEYVHADPSLNYIVARPIRLLIGPVHSLEPPRVHDRFSDEQLASWFLRSGPITEAPIQELAARLEEPITAVASITEEQIKQRLARVRRILPKLDVLAAERRQIASEFMETAEGKHALEQRIGQEIQRRSEELQEAVRKREAQAAEKESELDAQLEAKKDQYERKLLSLHQAIETRTQQKAELEATLIALKVDLERSTQTLADKVREGIPLIAALTTGLRPTMTASASSPSDSPGHNAAPWSNVPAILPSRSILDTLSEKQLFEYLVVAVKGAGLNVNRDFLANLYISMKASPINLIAGPPGHGKSTLVSSLADALGHKDAFLDIAVRRSWSDDRYLLGFYDAFHGRFDPGPTGLTSRLLQAQRDWEDTRIGVYIVVLDEFNLASPEYYFSQLMQVLPRDDVSERRLRLYDPLRDGEDHGIAEVRIYPNVRFWGTINYDETTERISPRMLDRTGMIVLTPRDVVSSEAELEDPGPATTPGISGEQLFGGFSRTAEQCGEEHWGMLEPVLGLVRKHSEEWGTGIPISPRCLRMMRLYLANSVGLLEPNSAVDFVIQQRLLPSLRGSGDGFRSRMRKLAELLTAGNFERSARHVQEALALAETGFGDIDFFIYH